MRSGTILLVGGYGHVGTLLAREVAIRYPGQLVLAGRSIEKAQALAVTLPGGVRATAIDVQKKESVEQAVKQAALVVNCSVDQREPSLVQAAIAHGCFYLDIGANAQAIVEMLELSAEAVRHGTCAVVGAGLDPGCTNVMAASASAGAGGAHAINVALLLSSRDTFGDAAVDYMLEALDRPMVVEYRGHHTVLSAYRERRHCVFPPPFGRKLAYRFPFPEQAFFAETLRAEQAANWYVMDSPIINLLLLASVRLGFTRLLQKESIRVTTRQLFQILSRLPGGTDDVCALAEVAGPKGTWCVSLTSHQESKTTALCALPIVQALYEQQLKLPGVWLPEQVIDPTAYLQTLSDLGLEIQISSKEEKHRKGLL